MILNLEYILVTFTTSIGDLKMDDGAYFVGGEFSSVEQRRLKCFNSKISTKQQQLPNHDNNITTSEHNLSQC